MGLNFLTCPLSTLFLRLWSHGTSIVPKHDKLLRFLSHLFREKFPIYIILVLHNFLLVTILILHSHPFFKKINNDNPIRITSSYDFFFFFHSSWDDLLLATYTFILVSWFQWSVTCTEVEPSTLLSTMISIEANNLLN